MKWKSCWLAGLGGSILLVGSALAGRPQYPAPVQTRTPPLAPVPAPAPPVAAPATGITQAEQEIQLLLNRLTELSGVIQKAPQGGDVWRYQVAQGEVMLHLAVRSTKTEERNNWLRMAVDSFYSAAVQAPENDPAASQRLIMLPAQIAAAYPGSPAVPYAALQEIQAAYTRVLTKPEGGGLAKAQALLCERWLQFAQQYPTYPEAPKAVMDAARMAESQGKTEDARRYYRYLIEHFAGQALARQAAGSLWRLGGDGQPLQLKAPYLFAGGENSGQPFDLAERQGKIVVLYFWSSASEQTAADFQTLKNLTDRYQYRGLEVVYVNLDKDPAKARVFLAGRLTAGTHVSETGGLESPLAERYGIQSLPQVFLVGKNGVVIQHSLTASQLDSVVTPHVEPRR